MPRKKGGGALTAAARTLGARGGKKGGPARARALNRKQRHDIAQKGGLAKARKKS